MAQMDELLSQIRSCRLCEGKLPLGPKPLIQFSEQSEILIVGQAPGLETHHAGEPWSDASGQRLRHWLGLNKEKFYDPKLVAIIPMGFCYPGRGTSGDLPPRKECAPQWHPHIFGQLKNVKVTFLVGLHAQKAFLKDSAKESLTETVRNWRKYQPEFFPLPHPSPLNNIWLSRNRWFEQKYVPSIRRAMARMGYID